MVERVGADSNVLVSFLTNRDAAQFEKSKGLFVGAREGAIEVVVCQAAISECVFVLNRLYGLSSKEIAVSLADVLDIPGVLPAHELAWEFALGLWPVAIPHFGDALLIATCQRAGVRSLATFDRNLARRLPSVGIGTYGW